jgi:hypothetical protein
MRKRSFRLRTVIENGNRPVVVLTYNLQDVQPWKQAMPCYQSAVYEADAAGLATNALLEGPIEHRSEELARQGHSALVARFRQQAA